MTTRVSDILPTEGNHAARPADPGVIPALYSCTEHGLIYRWDGTAWATWATLGRVQSIAAGTGINVDSTDPENPIVSATGGGGGGGIVSATAVWSTGGAVTGTSAGDISNPAWTPDAAVEVGDLCVVAAVANGGASVEAPDATWVQLWQGRHDSGTWKSQLFIWAKIVTDDTSAVAFTGAGRVWTVTYLRGPAGASLVPITKQRGGTDVLPPIPGRLVVPSMIVVAGQTTQDSAPAFPAIGQQLAQVRMGGTSGTGSGNRWVVATAFWSGNRQAEYFAGMTTDFDFSVTDVVLS